MDIKKVLLLGGSGFVGYYIVNRLSQRGTSHRADRRRERTKAPDHAARRRNAGSRHSLREDLTELMRGHDVVINWSASCIAAT